MIHLKPSSTKSINIAPTKTKSIDPELVKNALGAEDYGDRLMFSVERGFDTWHEVAASDLTNDELIKFLKVVDMPCDRDQLIEECAKRLNELERLRKLAYNL